MRGPPAPDRAIDPEETIALLQELVRIESPYFEEEAITEFVYEWLADAGLAPEYHPVTEAELTGFEGHNVIATVEGSDPTAPTLLVNAHVDTVVPVDGWEEDPCSGRRVDGRLYGQGAADMKGGLAAAMVAVRALAACQLRGTVRFTAVVDEEGPYGLGTNQLLRDGLTDDCDAAIVPEPGPILANGAVENPALLLGARGRFLYEVRVRGLAAHGSRPEDGANAVLDAARIIEGANEMSLGSHAVLGTGSICPLGVEGGGETITVPDRCRALIDRHVVIGETADSVLADLEAVIDSLSLDSHVDVGFREAPSDDVRYGPYMTDRDHPLVGSMVAGTERVTGTRPDIGYATTIGDFNYLGHRAALPTVIVGPDGGNIHGAGEFVDTDDVVDVARIIFASARDYLA